MKMIEYLDRDREQVMTNLRAVSTPADAQKILEKEADRLLLQYNEDCASVRVRDAASGMGDPDKIQVVETGSAGSSEPGE